MASPTLVLPSGPFYRLRRVEIATQVRPDPDWPHEGQRFTCLAGDHRLIRDADPAAVPGLAAQQSRKVTADGPCPPQHPKPPPFFSSKYSRGATQSRGQRPLPPRQHITTSPFSGQKYPRGRRSRGAAPLPKTKTQKAPTDDATLRPHSDGRAKPRGHGRRRQGLACPWDSTILSHVLDASTRKLTHGV